MTVYNAKVFLYNMQSIIVMKLGTGKKVHTLLAYADIVNLKAKT